MMDSFRCGEKSGKRTVMVVPRPAPLSTVTLPPCNSTQRLAMVNPNPVPGISAAHFARDKTR